MRPLPPLWDNRRSSYLSQTLSLAAIALFCALGSAQADDRGLPVDAERFTATVVPFIQRHCGSCHGERRQKAGLNLNALLASFDTPTWTKVFDRLESGEMPPKERRRPPTGDVGAVLDWVGANLVAHERADAVAVRRLSRTEYGNSIRDLLGVDVRVDDILPEDAELHGFDNIGLALTISPELVASYLESANLALDAAIVTRPRPAVIRKTMDLRRHARLTPHLMRETDDAVVVFHSESYVGTDFNDFVAPEDGLYRLRIRAYAWRSSDPLVLAVRTLNDPSRTRGVVGFYEVGRRPQVFDIKARLKKHDVIKITPFRLGLPTVNNPWKFDGPGIAVQSLAVEGPLHDQWPPRSHRMLFGDLDVSQGTLEDARDILSRFVPRAFRRPAAAAEIEMYVDLVRRHLDEDFDFVESLRAGLLAVLCAPQFLFLGLPHDDADTIRTANLFDLAARLSYFLWSSTPDEALLTAAGSGELGDPEVLARHVERLLDDPRSAALVDNFAGQWLNLRDINFTIPDQSLYPEFDELLGTCMAEETKRFFREILDQNLSLLNFIDSDFSILNSRLAEHYRIDGVSGLEFRRVELPEDAHRGGVLTHASVLKVTANGTNTSPVIRGVWVLENIMGTPPSPPPPDVASFEPSIVGAKTIREQLAMHRSVDSCRRCHRDIDPPGFALESYDVIGGWRDQYRTMSDGDKVARKVMNQPVSYKTGLAVDASGKTRDGVPFRDIEEFKEILLAEPDTFTRCITEKMLTYARGRPTGFSDRETVAEIMSALHASNRGFRTLVHHVARSMQ